jgi:glycine oxidase
MRRLGRLELLNSTKAEVRAREEAAWANAHWPRFDRDSPTMEVVEARFLQEVESCVGVQKFGGLLCRATAQVRVAELVAALRAACEKRGVVIREGVKAHRMEVTGERVDGVVCEGGKVVGDAYLVTAGAWSAMLGREVADVAPMVPAKGQGLALRRPAGVTLGRIVKMGTTYVIPWDEEILVGSTTEPEAGFDEAPTEAGREKLLAGAEAIVPGLQGAEVLRHWAGLRPENPEKPHPPVMGVHPRISNLYVCTGHYKTGIGLAPLVSMDMSTMVVERRSTSRLAPFHPRDVRE